MAEFINPENIYNHIPKPKVLIQKPPRYMSKSRPTVALETVKNKEPKRTMGPAKVEVSAPDKYLKKYSQEPKLPEKTQSLTFVRTNCAGKKPDVPARTDNAPVDIQTKREQESTKGECTKTTKVAPKKPEPIFVDTRNGHKQPIEYSGLVPKYIKKKDYGAVPEYVLQRNEEMQRAWEEHGKFLKDQQEQEAKSKLSHAERQTILQGLKMKWAKLNHEFQGLPFITDTLHLKRNRVRVEMEMKKLEDDINLIERFKIIYLPED
ncbi:enkurin-like isoform X1 [Scophthalmus maximus]|nr:enkurin-like isoform X1 [Scophthalmus maximus]